jgi:hypothetical protein
VARSLYSDEDKANVLAAASTEGVTGAAKLTGLSCSTIRGFQEQAERRPELANLAGEKSRQLSDRLMDTAVLIAAGLEGKIEDASLRDAAVALGILLDKSFLLQSEPTSIFEGLDGLSDEEFFSAVASLILRGNARNRPERS